MTRSIEWQTSLVLVQWFSNKAFDIAMLDIKILSKMSHFLDHFDIRKCDSAICSQSLEVDIVIALFICRSETLKWVQKILV